MIGTSGWTGAYKCVKLSVLLLGRHWDVCLSSGRNSTVKDIFPYIYHAWRLIEAVEAKMIALFVFRFKITDIRSHNWLALEAMV